MYLSLSPGPADRETLDARGAAKAEVKAGIVDRQVAGGAAAGPLLLCAASGNTHAGAYCAGIQTFADQLHLRPMSHGDTRVAKELRQPAGITDYDVDISVIVQISEGRPAAHLANFQRLPACGGAVFKAAVAAVSVEPVALGIAGRVNDVAGKGVQVSIGYVDVQPPIEVEVKKTHSPGDLGQAAGIGGGYIGGVLVVSAAPGPVEVVGLGVVVGHKEVGVSISIEVA